MLVNILISQAMNQIPDGWKSLRQTSLWSDEISSGDLQDLIADLRLPLKQLHADNKYYGLWSLDTVFQDKAGRYHLLPGVAQEQEKQADQQPPLPACAAFEQFTDDVSWPLGEHTDVYGLATLMRFLILKTQPMTAVARLVEDQERLINMGLDDRINRQYLRAIDMASALEIEQRLTDLDSFSEMMGVSVVAAPVVTENVALSPSIATVEGTEESVTESLTDVVELEQSTPQEVLNEAETQADFAIEPIDTETDDVDEVSEVSIGLDELNMTGAPLASAASVAAKDIAKVSEVEETSSLVSDTGTTDEVPQSSGQTSLAGPASQPSKPVENEHVAEDEPFDFLKTQKQMLQSRQTQKNAFTLRHGAMAGGLLVVLLTLVYMLFWHGADKNITPELVQHEQPQQEMINTPLAETQEVTQRAPESMEPVVDTLPSTRDPVSVLLTAAEPVVATELPEEVERVDNTETIEIVENAESANATQEETAIEPSVEELVVATIPEAETSTEEQSPNLIQQEEMSVTSVTDEQSSNEQQEVSLMSAMETERQLQLERQQAAEERRIAAQKEREEIKRLQEEQRERRRLQAQSAQQSQTQQANNGTLRLDIRPWGNVSVNGRDQGASPPRNSIRLAPGTYTIEVTNGRLKPYTTSVTIKAGGTTTVRHSFD